jgi:hypothetical protein
MSDNRTTDRTSFAAAGTRMREAFERLARSEKDLPPKVTAGMAWKMLAVILCQTTSWSKTAEYTFQDHLIATYGINDRDGRRILKALDDLAVIGWHPSNAHGRKSLLVLAPSNKEAADPKATPAETVPASGRDTSDWPRCPGCGSPENLWGSGNAPEDESACDCGWRGTNADLLPPK